MNIFKKKVEFDGTLLKKTVGTYVSHELLDFLQLSALDKGISKSKYLNSILEEHQRVQQREGVNFDFLMENLVTKVKHAYTLRKKETPHIHFSLFKKEVTAELRKSVLSESTLTSIFEKIDNLERGVNETC